MSSSPWCTRSRDLPHFFPCTTRGRLPHPTNMTLYLYCIGPGYQACVCNCQYEDMCYDRETRTCKFTYLAPDANCGSHVIPVSQRHSELHEEHYQNDDTADDSGKDGNDIGGARVTPITNFKDLHRRQRPTSPPLTFMKRPHKDYKDYKYDYSHKASWPHKNKHNISKSTDGRHKTNGHNEVVEQHHGNIIYTTNTGSPSDARNDALAVKETSKPFRPTILEDDSLFPAWAIALVVLCVVIIFMLIVLILY